MKRSYKLDAIVTAVIAMAFTYMTQSMKIECPHLKCVGESWDKDVKHLADNICYQFDGGNPSKEIVADSCKYHQVNNELTTGPVYCDFDLLSGKMAWVDELTQHIQSTIDYEEEADKAVKFAAGTSDIDGLPCPLDPVNTHI